MKKLDDKRYGPFKIKKKFENGTHYELQLPRQWRIHNKFNELHLSPYVEPYAENQKQPPPPPPEIIDQQLEYDVEEVLKSRMNRGRLQYLVKWEGYPHEENTWENEENLKNSPDAIREFHTRFPNAPRRIILTANNLMTFVPYENHTIANKARYFEGNFDDGSEENTDHFRGRKS
jgi:hypothetical protein